RARPGGQLGRPHRQVRVHRLEVASLGVELLVAEAGDQSLGRPPAVDAHPAVALLLRGMEMPVQLADAPHLVGNVGLGRLDLLHADEVGILRGGPFLEALALRGADAVEVGRDDSQHESPGALAMRPRTTGAPVGESDPEVYWQAS